METATDLVNNMVVMK